MNPISAHVLVFDSGVGGLSIVSHLREMLPAISLTYLADNQFFPYGMMHEQALTERVLKLLTSAQQRYQPDLIVIACNSASTLVLPPLREKLATPIVGVVPAIKPAAQLSASKVIGLLATPGTIRRDYTDDLINEFAPGCEVIRVGSSHLVQVVEESLRGIQHPPAVFEEIVTPFLESGHIAQLDTIVLACTHFPLVTAQLAQVLPSVSHWIDSGEAIARRVRQLLTERDCKTAPVGNRALLTGSESDLASMRQNFARFGFTDIAQFEN